MILKHKRNKKLKKIFALFGISFNIKNIFIKRIGLNFRKNIIYLKKTHFLILEKIVKKFVIGRILKEKKKSNILFLSKIKNYRGMRHSLYYPVRGQRTHTNAKTRKKYKI